MRDEDLTMKTRLVKLLYDKGEAWDYELVEEIKRVSGKNTEYWTWVIRYWVMELENSNIFKSIEADIDDGSHFAKDKVLYKVKMTKLGKERIESLL
ncbi:MAG: hypothetical protein PHW56_08975 [Methanosarcinaceae archaeon]|nr:hypothetical protein [Methanosarcinaceae archaeon]